MDLEEYADDCERTRSTTPSGQPCEGGQLLHGLDYSLQSNRKTEEGRDHPDRDAQFRHINTAVKRCLAHGWPVISVDTKKKELLGNFANAGQQWRPVKQPREGAHA